jgi:hypothetical protein
LDHPTPRVWFSPIVCFHLFFQNNCPSIRLKQVPYQVRTPLFRENNREPGATDHNPLRFGDI